MNARVKAPTKPMTAVEPERHSRLGGGGSSSIKRSIKGQKVVESGYFVFGPGSNGGPETLGQALT